ncbi:hypothetical protein N9M27_03530 [Flavobacteriales bacterium]|nr:hypothetical protein [Flavobacteriales bacterium]
MLRRSFFGICLLFFLLISVFLSCSKTKADQPILVDSTLCDSVIVSYGNDIVPILQINCIGCHNSTFASGGNNWESYAEVSNQITQIICAINHNSDCYSMPRFADKLEDSLIQKFECWAVQGALNN